MNQIIRYTNNAALLIKCEFKKLAQYRIDFLSQIIILPFKMLISAIIWIQIYAAAPMNSEIYPLAWIVTYYVVQCLIEFVVTPFCIVTYNLMIDIKNGDLDIYLVRPVNYFFYQYFSQLKILLLFIAVYIGYYFIQNGFSLRIDLFLIILLCIFSTLITFCLFALVGILSFRVENILTLRDNLWNIIKLLSGAIIPLSFYPELFKNITSLLPFQYIYYKPIINVMEMTVDFNDLFYSGMWSLALVAILMLSWKNALKQYASQGG